MARAEGSVAAGFMGLMPVSALLLSYLLLDEPFRWIQPLGFAVVFAGVLLLSSIQTAINVMGMPPHYTMMIQGLLVLAAVLLDTAKNNLRRSYF